MERPILEKVARMVLFGVPQTQIAKAISVSDSRVSQIIELEEYKEILADVSTEYFEQHQSLNDGWNSVEALALSQVVNSLQWSKDPDFALRAASMANKAQRRGNANNRPIDGQTGARAVFYLTTTFIDKLQQLNITEKKNGATNGVGGVDLSPGQEEDNKTPQKQSNFMVPERVEKMFTMRNVDDKNKEDELLSFFPEAQMVPAE